MKNKIILILMITLMTVITLYAANNESNNDKVKDIIMNNMETTDDAKDTEDIQIEDNTLIEPDKEADEYTENENII